MADEHEDAPLSFAKLLEGETCDEMIQSTIRWVRANATATYDKETKTVRISCPPYPGVERFEASEITVPFYFDPDPKRVLVHPDLAEKWAKERAEKIKRSESDPSPQTRPSDDASGE